MYLGKTRFKLGKKLKLKRDLLAHREIFVSEKTQRLLSNLYKEAKEGFRVESGFITRGLWDLTRIAAIESGLKGYDEVQEEEIYEAIKFAPIQLLGYTRGQLTMKQMDIYSVICDHPDGINPKKIEEITGLPESTIMKGLKELQNLKLIEVIQVGKNTIYYPKTFGIE